ncbi:aminoglycoside phosphotransferase family protein [Streptomyces sp. NPDC001515]
MTAVWSTHGLDLGPVTVTKRFRPGSHGQAAREWRALTLLDAHAPGLAPAPRHADLDAERPSVAMSRLPGAPLRGRPLDAARLDALAAAVSRVYGAVPAPLLAEVPVRPGSRAYLTGRIHAWTPRARPRVGPEAGAAMDAGLEWLAGTEWGPAGAGGPAVSGPGGGSAASGPGVPASSGPGAPTASGPGVPAVFGPGDGNLANYLWDGSRVRIVDFEESGRSDRPLELAEITEHVGSWVDGEPLDAEAFLARFDLTAGERSLLRDTRRLLALVWLFLLALDDPDHPRNPPGTVDRQAARLIRLLR